MDTIIFVIFGRIFAPMETHLRFLYKTSVCIIFSIISFSSCVLEELDRIPYDTSLLLTRSSSNDESYSLDNGIPFQYSPDTLCGSRITLDTLPNGLVLEVRNSHSLLDGDIIVDNRNYPLIESIGTRSAYMTTPDYYWPRRKVYYKYHTSFTSSYQAVTQYAMMAITAACGITFEPAGSNTTNYILFKCGNANESYVGMVGGEQVIKIKSLRQDIITHEIMHALGFFHEHARSDRDSYITVNYSNIRPSHRHSFNKYSSSGYSGIDIDSFDFNSIMLYNSIITDESFVYDTTVAAMTKLDGSYFNGGVVLSSGDARGLRSIYGPPIHRLENQTVQVIQDDVGSTDEIYEVEIKTYIKFYSSETCTSSMQTEYPRCIKLRKNIQSCNSYNQMITYSTYKYLTVPVGVDSVFVDDYINFEHHLYSNPLEVYAIDYEIVNSHVIPYSY